MIGGLTFGIFLIFNPQGGHSVEQSIMIERRYWRRRLTLVIYKKDFLNLVSKLNLVSNTARFGNANCLG